uniref:CD180 antigen n=1 Tax=Jaculus jaculus TaxID=51337 RepID=A0A8C5KY41_JACJA
MAPRDVGCRFLAVLLLASCEAIASSDRMCTEREALTG